MKRGELLGEVGGVLGPAARAVACGTAAVPASVPDDDPVPVGQAFDRFIRTNEAIDPALLVVIDEAATLRPDQLPAWASTVSGIGVQLVGAYAREDVLLGVSAQLEAAAPWADRRPPIHAARWASARGCRPGRRPPR